jgi:hypothetical protein
MSLPSAEGKDSWAGFPGVRPGTRKIDQRISSISGLQLGLARQPGWEKMHENIWNSRAWTYQEAVLSRRLLVFAKDEVLFLCENDDIWYESIYRENPPRKIDRTEAYVESFTGNQKISMQPRPFSNSSRIAALDNVEKLMTVYGQRRMMYQDDAIRAFQRIMNKLSAPDDVK